MSHMYHGSLLVRNRSPSHQIIPRRRRSQTRLRSRTNNTRAAETPHPNSDRQNRWSTVIDDGARSLIRYSHMRQCACQDILNPEYSAPASLTLCPARRCSLRVTPPDVPRRAQSGRSRRRKVCSPALITLVHSRGLGNKHHNRVR